MQQCSAVAKSCPVLSQSMVGKKVEVVKGGSGKMETGKKQSSKQRKRWQAGVGAAVVVAVAGRRV